jgi:hypothetical protein
VTQWLALLAVAVLAIAACGSAQPTVSTTPSPTPRDDCALTTEPGPADEPDRGFGELDLTDYGGGRWRLCLTEPTAATVEHSAWCIWTADRTAVSEVNGLPARIGAVDYDAYLSINSNQFELNTTDQTSGGLAATYKPGPVIPRGNAADDGRAGYLDFEVVLTVDPEVGAPAGALPGYAGSMRWQCGDPPPPRR